jgi:hypothetical protein
MSTTVNTSKTEHRKLRFNSVADMWAEVERIQAAERGGRLRRTGNWTTGQAFNHLATWVEYSNHGFPSTLRPPWIVKVIVGMMKNRFLNGSLPRGRKIPGVPGGTTGIEVIAIEEGAIKLRQAWDRLIATPPPHPSPLFGVMTHEEWIKGHLRHAELHLGYLHP